MCCREDAHKVKQETTRENIKGEDVANVEHACRPSGRVRHPEADLATMPPAGHEMDEGSDGEYGDY